MPGFAFKRLMGCEPTTFCMAGGHAIIATFAPDGPERCSGLPVIRYSAGDVSRLLGDRFHVLEHRHETHHTPQQFTWIAAVRTAKT